MSRARLEARVTGVVQGVGFRAFVRGRADSLQLDGYVANRPDGSVEVVAEGPRERLDALVEALEQGPGASRVSGVEREWDEPHGDFDGFSVRF